MLPKKAIEEFEEIYKKEFGEEISDEEALEQGTRPVNFFKVLYKMDVKEKMRKEKLKKYPKGFHLPESEIYNCCVCHNQIQGKDTWYDKDGIKCLLCQKALDQGIITSEICRNDDSWYSTMDLKDKFGLHYQTVMKKIRLGELKARVILNEKKQPYFYVFLKRENKGKLILNKK